jgi:hypothetical protein
MSTNLKIFDSVKLNSLGSNNTLLRGAHGCRGTVTRIEKDCVFLRVRLHNGNMCFLNVPKNMIEG